MVAGIDGAFGPVAQPPLPRAPEVREAGEAGEAACGLPFTADVVIGEERMTTEEFTGEVDCMLPEPPTPQGVIPAPDRRASA
ncbi:hypothetical protein ACFWH4_23770 [Streptomyces sp. NPDC127091]|uniref:hypothetical protein n=1 Tax=Streptomyces sp. NPDC127091 TaxID=3347134 RepID=UPI00365E002B